MEPSIYTQQFEEFFREKCSDDVNRLASVYPQKKSLRVDYNLLDAYDPKMGDDLLENPAVVIRAASNALREMRIVNNKGEQVIPNVRFYNLPKQNKMLIRNINSMRINRLIAVEGIITKITDVRPKLDVAAFECKRCGRVYKIPQTEHQFGALKEPQICSCERRDFQLSLDQSTFIDVQRAEIQEPLEAVVGGEPAKVIAVWMEDDLTNMLLPGNKIELTGVLKLRPPKDKASVYDIFLEAVDTQLIEKEFEEIEVSEEDEGRIKELAKDPYIYDKIVRSIAPSIYGHNEIKEALALQLFGGTKGKVAPDGMRIRPDIHLLLIGDPGTGKSQLLSYIKQLAPKGLLVSGKSASAAGLTATAEKDEFSADGGWTLKAGALVLASGGLAAIDEFDKMTEEDRSAMHEAMEQQRISIAKAGIVTTFKAQTTILAAANPKFGRFDPMQPPATQFDIPTTLLSRFDLIFSIKDVLDAEKDKSLADHVLNTHRVAASKHSTEKLMSEKELEEAEKKVTPDIEPELLRKYIAYARRNYQPLLTKEAADKFQAYYLELRKLGESQGTVAITPRQLEALIRGGEASAKGRLSNVVEFEDAERAIRLNRYMMQQVGIDQETGRFDIDIIATGKPKSQMDKMRTVYTIIKDLNKEHDEVTFNMIAEEAAKIDLTEDKLDQILQSLRREGSVYCPRHSVYKITGERSE